MVYDILCRNNKDGNEQELYKSIQRCLIIPRILLAIIIFSLRCFLKDKIESSVRPKCFCSFIFATTVPLNIVCG